MTVIFSSGFETGDFSEWSINSFITIVSSPTHHGSYAASVTVQAATSYGRACKYISAVSEVYMREYVCFASLPTAASIFGVGPRFAYGTGSGTVIAYVMYDATQSKWGVRNSVAGVSYLESGTTSLQTGVWYCVELYVKIDSTTGAVKLWVDGVLKVDRTNVNTGTNNIDNVSVSCYTNTNEPEPRTVYHDCAVVADTYIGLEQVLKQWSQTGRVSHTFRRPHRTIKTTQNLKTSHVFSRPARSLKVSQTVNVLHVFRRPFRTVKFAQTLNSVHLFLRHKTIKLTQTLNLTHFSRVNKLVKFAVQILETVHNWVKHVLGGGFPFKISVEEHQPVNVVVEAAEPVKVTVEEREPIKIIVEEKTE